jgi:hypothetical protein
MDLKIGWEDVDWIEVALYRIQRRPFANQVINFWGSIITQEVLSSRALYSDPAY